MIGLDTNVLLRWLLRDVPAQSALVDALMATLSRDRPAFVSQAVMVEVHSVLVRQLRQPKTVVLDLFERLMRSQEFVFDDEETLWDALQLAQAGADFPDALIALTGQLFGCDRTVTFDREAATRTGMTLLS